MSKNPGSDLAKMRWEKTTEDERSELMSSTAKSRWDRMTEKERKAEGARLAAARAAKKKAGAK